MGIKLHDQEPEGPYVLVVTGLTDDGTDFCSESDNALTNLRRLSIPYREVFINQGRSSVLDSDGKIQRGRLQTIMDITEINEKFGDIILNLIEEDGDIPIPAVIAVSGDGKIKRVVNDLCQTGSRVIQLTLFNYNQHATSST